MSLSAAAAGAAGLEPEPAEASDEQTPTPQRSARTVRQPAAKRSAGGALVAARSLAARPICLEPRPDVVMPSSDQSWLLWPRSWQGAAQQLCTCCKQ